MDKKIIRSYSPLMKTLHWLIAIAVIAMLCFGLFMDDIPQDYKVQAFSVHKSVGLTILLLMVIRIVVAHYSKKPALPESMKVWEKVLARFVQYGFYILLILMPLSGWLMSTAANKIPVYLGLFSLPFPGVSPDKSLAHFMQGSHELLADIIFVFILLHVCGALKHYFIDKNDVLQTMLRNRNKP